ncbi:MAG: farnesyl diphosphate synthase [Desulfococcaceae bacterium]|jgi:geranylgeranyl diphosphate synthase type II|nr:farnesyl diphosphate synthase [Desulfococcaceae bacterium]
MKSDLKNYLAKKREEIENALDKMLPESPDRIVSAMRYSLMAGGKRLRPVLCLAAAEAVGGQVRAAMHGACALEMIHTYSLIHDDLPAMDDDELRRGRPTCHKAFDEATAILAGDALLTFAFEILADAKTAEKDEIARQMEIIRILSKAAGYRGMVEGQMRDMESENIRRNPAELEKLHRLKTGALIEAAVLTGAVSGRGTESQTECLRQYARNIGLAFQVADDILNVEGDPEIMGKAAGTDAKRNKNTYPSLMGLEESKTFAAALIGKAVSALADFDEKAEPLRAIAVYIRERKR